MLKCKINKFMLSWDLFMLTFNRLLYVLYVRVNIGNMIITHIDMASFNFKLKKGVIYLFESPPPKAITNIFYV